LRKTSERETVSAFFLFFARIFGKTPLFLSTKDSDFAKITAENDFAFFFLRREIDER